VASFIKILRLSTEISRHERLTTTAGRPVGGPDDIMPTSCCKRRHINVLTRVTPAIAETLQGQSHYERVRAMLMVMLIVNCDLEVSFRVP